MGLPLGVIEFKNPADEEATIRTARLPLFMEGNVMSEDEKTPIPENDVLIATVLWLKDRGAIPLMCSLASGLGIDLQAEEKRLREALSADGYENDIIMGSTGPDVFAFSKEKEEVWKVECKGAGTGTPQTQRNNFDRALASVVTYFRESTPKLSVRLGLALPETRTFLNQLKHVHKDLRKRLDLWILLLDPQDRRSIRAISPDEEI